MSEHFKQFSKLARVQSIKQGRVIGLVFALILVMGCLVLSLWHHKNHSKQQAQGSSMAENDSILAQNAKRLLALEKQRREVHAFHFAQQSYKGDSERLSLCHVLFVGVRHTYP